LVIASSSETEKSGSDGQRQYHELCLGEVSRVTEAKANACQLGYLRSEAFAPLPVESVR